MTASHDGESPPPAGDRFGHLLDLSLGGLAAFLLFALMILTFVDVFGRTFINAPVPGGYEITEIIMGMLIFVGLPVVCWREEHITIDLLDGITPAALVEFREVLVNLIGTVAVGVMCWQTWVFAVELTEYGELTEFLQVPVAPVMFVISVFAGIATLLMAANAVRHFRRRETEPSDGGVV